MTNRETALQRIAAFDVDFADAAKQRRLEHVAEWRAKCETMTKEQLTDAFVDLAACFAEVVDIASAALEEGS